MTGPATTAAATAAGFDLPAAWRRVRIATLDPSSNDVSLILGGFVDSLARSFAELGATVDTAVNRLGDEGCVNIVLGAHLLDQEQAATMLRANTVILNLEQFVSPQVSRNPTYLETMGRLVVWDFSAGNIARIRERCGSRHTVRLGIGFCDGLRTVPAAAEQDIDVLFYGLINDRRQRALDALHKTGLTLVVASGVFGAERDALIARAKVVLNVSYYENAAHELLRTGHLLANRKAVVSECGAHTEIDDDLREAMVAVPYEDLTAACVALVRDDARRRALEERGHALFRGRPQTGFVRRAIAASSHPLPRRLHLGAGGGEDALSVDPDPRSGADIIADPAAADLVGCVRLTRRFGLVKLLPGAFDAVDAPDVLHRVRDLPGTMTNLLALLREGGTLTASVPYDLSLGAWSDPRTVRAFNERSWVAFTEGHPSLGWGDTRFLLGGQRLRPSVYGESLKAQGWGDDAVIRQPRAVDRIEVALVKRTSRAAAK